MIVVFLEKIHNEMYEQKVVIERKYHKNEILLKENIQFISMLEKTLDNNYESFSPRDIDHESNKKIIHLKEEQIKIKQESIELEKKFRKLKGYLDELDSILKVARDNKKILQDCEILIERDEFFHRKILETQEMERQRIARELHDSIVQSLTNMVHKVEFCSKLMDMDIVRCKLEMQTMSKSMRELLNDMRRVIYDLRPMSLDDIGLNVTLERELSRIQKVGTIKVNYEVKGIERKLDPIISLTILRVVQEACNNILKHSNAKNVSVLINYESEQILLEIIDDGVGFEMKTIKKIRRDDDSGFGLSMMKERIFLLSGEIEIKSEINKGTRIKVKVPINDKEEA